MVTIGDVEKAAAKYTPSTPITVGNVPAASIHAAVVHLLSLRQTKASEVMAWGDDQWQEAFAAAFGSTDLKLRLAILRSLAEFTA